MKTLLLITIAIGSLGCAAKVVTVPVDLGPCPLPPQMVKMNAEQFEDFSQLQEGTVKVLNKREDQLRAYADTLCAIIETTNQ